MKRVDVYFKSGKTIEIANVSEIRFSGSANSSAKTIKDPDEFQLSPGKRITFIGQIQNLTLDSNDVESVTITK